MAYIISQHTFDRHVYCRDKDVFVFTDRETLLYCVYEMMKEISCVYLQKGIKYELKKVFPDNVGKTGNNRKTNCVKYIIKRIGKRIMVVTCYPC